MDCSWGFGNNACDGGEEFRAYEWIMKHGGIATELSYGQYLGVVCSPFIFTFVALFLTHVLQANSIFQKWLYIIVLELSNHLLLKVRLVHRRTLTFKVISGIFWV